MAAGNYYIYKGLRDNTSSKGSTLVFKWAHHQYMQRKDNEVIYLEFNASTNYYFPNSPSRILFFNKIFSK